MSTLSEYKSNTVTIIEGEDRDISLTLIKSNQPFLAFDLTGNTEVLARFLKEDGNFLEVSKTGGEITVVEDKCGQIKISLTKAQTLLLAKGDKQSFEVVITIGGKDRIAQVMNKLYVKPSLKC